MSEDGITHLGSIWSPFLCMPAWCIHVCVYTKGVRVYTISLIEAQPILGQAIF